MKRIKLTAWTDGSCRGNEHKDITKRFGGYAFLRSDGVTFSKGYRDNPTNNRSEALAVLAALKSIKDMKNVDLEIVTDSNYMITSIGPKGRTERLALRIGDNIYLPNGKPACNGDLLAKIFDEMDAIEKRGGTIKITKTTGHATDPNNNEVDRMAQNAAIMEELK